MGRARDALRQGRRDIHKEWAVPALYIATPGATPIPCTVRQHDKFVATGQLGGKTAGYAQAEDNTPKLVFITDDAPEMIRRLAIVSLEPGVAFRVDHAHPPHGITILVDVIPVPVAETTDLPVPEST